MVGVVVGEDQSRDLVDVEPIVANVCQNRLGCAVRTAQTRVDDRRFVTAVDQVWQSSCAERLNPKSPPPISAKSRVSRTVLPPRLRTRRKRNAGRISRPPRTELTSATEDLHRLRPRSPREV